MVAESNEGPYGVAVGEAGEVWTTLVHAGVVTLWGSGLAVRLDSRGAVVEEVALGDGSEPHGLALAADGLWVALEIGVLAHIHA